MPNTQNPETKQVRKGDDLLDSEFRQSYFKQLVGQFRTIGKDVKDDEARQQAEAIAALDSATVQWDDIYQLELAIIRLEPELQSRRRAWVLRSEYENVAPKEYVKYMKSNPPDPDKDPPDKVRADLIRVQQELNWYYTVLWVQESFRALLLKRITRRTLQYFGGYVAIGVLLIALGFFGGLLNLFEKKPHDAPKTNAVNLIIQGATNITIPAVISEPATNPPSGSAKDKAAAGKKEESPFQRATEMLKEGIPVFGTYWLVVFAGTLGALLSILRRIQSMSLDGNTDLNLVELERNSASINFSPLLGAIFALLLLFMFMGGLLSGSLFPTCAEGPTHVFLGCVPATCADLAKLIIWCFIAGFAERLVPDALDKLQNQSTAGRDTGAPKKTESIG